MAAFLRPLNTAKRAKTGKPQLIIAKALIGEGIPEVQGTAKAHGEGGAKFGDAARIGLGLPADQHFYVSDDVYGYFAAHRKRLARGYNKWKKAYAAWSQANPERAALLDS